MIRASATAMNFNKDRATLQIPWEHIEPTSEPNRIFTRQKFDQTIVRL